MEKIAFFHAFAPVVAIVGVAGMVGWVVTTWMRIRAGYPLEGSWGKPVYPQKDGGGAEQLRLVAQENAQLRADLAAMKDRLVTVERIVTDAPSRLANDIDALRDRAN